MKKLFALVLVVAMAMSSIVFAQADGEYKDTLIVAAYGDQGILDPQVNVDNDKILRLFYRGLLTHDQSGAVVPDMAESYESSEDGLTWTFHLKQGIKFAHGQDFTAADVVATFERLLNPEHPLRYTEKVEFIKSVEAVDDYTVKFELAYQYGIVAETFALQCCFILCKDDIAEFGYDIGMDPATINGTGPYTLVSWAPDEEMVMTAVEGCYLGDAGTKNLIFKIIPEAASRGLAIETGEVDIIDRPAVGDYPRLAETPGLVGVSQLGYGMLGFQFSCLEKSECSDPRVRQAINYAIDTETIAQALYGAIGEQAAHSPLVPGVFGYVDMGTQGYDVEKAKALLAEAGYADGFELSMMTYPGYNKGAELAEVVKEYLAEVGINVTITTFDAAQFNGFFGIKPEDHNFDMFIMGFGGSGMDADGSLRRVMQTSQTGDNTNNYGFYSNAEVDELLVAAVTEIDQTKRAEMYARIQEIVYNEDPFACYVLLRGSQYVMSDKVEGFNINAIQVVEYENVKVRAN